jgi:hypothetical protein
MYGTLLFLILGTGWTDWPNGKDLCTSLLVGISMSKGASGQNGTSLTPEGAWVSNRTYQEGQLVFVMVNGMSIQKNGNLNTLCIGSTVSYSSQTNNNLGNDPTRNDGNWSVFLVSYPGPIGPTVSLVVIVSL